MSRIISGNVVRRGNDRLRRLELDGDGVGILIIQNDVSGDVVVEYMPQISFRDVCISRVIGVAPDKEVLRRGAGGTEDREDSSEDDGLWPTSIRSGMVFHGI